LAKRTCSEGGIGIESFEKSDPMAEIAQDLCRKRSKGIPLQYLLGSEFFGELEITCRPGVLIPRYSPITLEIALNFSY